MNIETLKVFRDLIETENYSRTAEMNFISQSAVSQQIKKLEFIFRTKLFDKKENKLKLTESGKVFYNASKKIIYIYDEAVSSIKKDLKLKNNEQIKIEAIYSLGIYMIGDYIKSFMNNNPFTKINLEYKKYTEILENVKKGKTDFGFMACCLNLPREVASLHLKNEEMIFIMPYSSAFDNKDFITLEEIAKFKLILFDKTTPSRKFIEKIFKDNNIKINVSMDIDNIEALKATVMSGAGVSIIPLSCLREDELKNRIKYLRIKNIKLMRPIYMIYNKKKKMTSTASNFFNMMLAKKKEYILENKNE